MDLLTKFDAIEIKADSRISEADLAFCQAHQEAYNDARNALAELACFWEDIVAGQEKLLPLASRQVPELYVSSYSHLHISKETIQEQSNASHTVFIAQLIGYFSRTYHCSLETDLVKEALLPKKPDYHEKGLEGRMEQYEDALQSLSLRYTDILDQIFLQTGGRGLYEEAVRQLVVKCQEAVRIRYAKSPNFEQKKNVIQFTAYFCNYRSQFSDTYWELSSRMHDILRGIAHFELGHLSFLPHEIAAVLNGGRLKKSQYDFPSCQRVQSIRLFKNRRVDIKFTSETEASQFVKTYLGRIN